jgi:hypothetical protein
VEVMLKGFKTLSFGLLIAILPQMLSYVTSFDFVHAFGLSPNAASIIGVIIVGLRAMTTTSIFQSK